MGAEEFRKAPMMHHKLTTLAITRFNTEQRNKKLIKEAKKLTSNSTS
jgi:hypothetical protein